jgi:hypothetical protein
MGKNVGLHGFLSITNSCYIIFLEHLLAVQLIENFPVLEPEDPSWTSQKFV